MDLLTDPTASATDPGVPALTGTRGYFVGATSGIATRVRYWWLNLVAKELVNVVTAAGLTPSPTAANQVSLAIPLLCPGRLLNIQYFNTAGTFTYTPTTGTNSVVVEVLGAGGAGGGTANTGAGQTSFASNGGGGSFARKRLTSGFSGATVVVGAAGVGAVGAAGGAGGQSSFGAVIAAGGNGGPTEGATSSTGFVVTLPVSAAAPTTGDLNIKGSLPGANFLLAGGSITQNIAESIYGPSYGAGGVTAPPIGASTSGSAGGPGGGGIVIVYEYA